MIDPQDSCADLVLCQFVGVPTFRRVGAGWIVAYQGRGAYLRDLLGMHYLADLLVRPHERLAAMDLLLARSAGNAEQDCAWRRTSAPQTSSSSAGDMLDQRARAVYGARMKELRAELARVQRDAPRREQLERELGFLRKELSRAVDRWGRVRLAGCARERARVSVTRAIRKAVAEILRFHPALGTHLAGAVHTGNCCSYDPTHSERISWLV